MYLLSTFILLSSLDGLSAISIPGLLVTPANQSVYYLLYTKNHKDGFQHIDPTDDSSLGKTDFNPNNPTKILVHGWKNSFMTPFPQLVKDAFLDTSDVNVIAFDWSYASNIPYSVARLMVSELGEKVLRLVSYLIKNGTPSDSLHLIGHSLGAHIAGVAGKLASKEMAIILRRVTGLDPAGPLFTALNGDKIDTASASYVDVIHTCGDLLGYFDQLGHADFYPNGGVDPQPGCGLDLDGTCSNGRVTELFAESIRHPGAFMGVPCDNYQDYGGGACKPPPFVEMGENLPRGNVGKYFFRTASTTPYGRGTVYP